MDGADYLLAHPYLALYATLGAFCAVAGLVIVAHYFDPTKGVLTLAILIAVSVIIAAYASLIYTVNQTPLTEILIGSLSTALGAVVAYWMGRGDRD